MKGVQEKRPPKSLKFSKFQMHMARKKPVYLIRKIGCECFSFIILTDLDQEHFKDLGAFFLDTLYLEAGWIQGREDWVQGVG